MKPSLSREHRFPGPAGGLGRRCTHCALGLAGPGSIPTARRGCCAQHPLLLSTNPQCLRDGTVHPVMSYGAVVLVRWRPGDCVGRHVAEQVAHLVERDAPRDLVARALPATEMFTSAFSCSEKDLRVSAALGLLDQDRPSGSWDRMAFDDLMREIVWVDVGCVHRSSVMRHCDSGQVLGARCDHGARSVELGDRDPMRRITNPWDRDRRSPKEAHRDRHRSGKRLPCQRLPGEGPSWGQAPWLLPYTAVAVGAARGPIQISSAEVGDGPERAVAVLPDADADGGHGGFEDVATVTV
jgi:hypothetical protein